MIGKRKICFNENLYSLVSYLLLALDVTIQYVLDNGPQEVEKKDLCFWLNICSMQVSLSICLGHGNLKR